VSPLSFPPAPRSRRRIPGPRTNCGTFSGFAGPRGSR
jgi:hypothetical protein